uniref:Uncharacterized protein n=1 Tax=Arundo donax TaxID=35708 RepID=A0A0A9GEL0_ARUDO
MIWSVDYESRLWIPYLHIPRELVRSRWWNLQKIAVARHQSVQLHGLTVDVSSHSCNL